MFWIFSALRNPQRTKVPTAGFSLVELLISISIMVIVASIILTRQTAFNGSVLLRGQAYEVALQAREVQLNAVSASGNTGTFRSVQGLHFNSDSTLNNQYRIFVDNASGINAGFYDPGEEFGRQGILDPRFEIREVRVVSASGDTINGTEVSVVFVRPNFDARFFDIDGELDASSLEIDIARRDVVGTGIDVVRTLEITSTGQIAVQ